MAVADIKTISNVDCLEQSENRFVQNGVSVCTQTLHTITHFQIGINNYSKLCKNCNIANCNFPITVGEILYIFILIWPCYTSFSTDFKKQLRLADLY